MEKISEKRICQNCKKNFAIEPDDFSFYEKMKVPLPTWCPHCQLIRRLIFRNESNLYHRIDDFDSNKNLISMYSQDKKVTVYERKTWWEDGWDVFSFGKEYSFSEPFFKQLADLFQKVPFPSLLNWNAVNSDYCNYTTDNKNCYLVFGGDFNENCSYSKFNFHSKDSQDLYWVNKCDLCYECIDVDSCYKILFSQNCKACTDCMFLYDCTNCTNCLGCIGLRNKSFCIFNDQYSEDEYKKKLETFNLNTIDGIESIKSIFYNFKLKFPHKYANILKSVDCIGDNIFSSKNCINCFDIDNECKDLKNSILAGWGGVDAISVNHFGHNSELAYDSMGVFSGSQNIRFSLFQPSSINVSYSYNCPSSSNILGCVGIKKGNYCILNKQYSKEEYEELIPRIIKHMNDMPYKDSKGKEYKYGEFFPPEFSPFCYNETVAQEYFPLTKEEALEQGYKWKDKEERNYKIDIKNKNIPNDIKDVDESILGKVIECKNKGKEIQCTEAFRITEPEYKFYKNMNLPLPRFCPNCRHYNRLQKRNPLKLWHRKCMKEGCTNEFETSYAPDRLEIVYCESCYNKEVY